MSQKSKDADVAAEGYTQALQDNPWLWEAYTSLCDMGMAPLPDYTFPEPPTAHRSSSTATLRPSSASAPREAIPSIASTPQNGSLPTQHGISRLHPNPGDPANPFHSPVRPTRGWSPNPAAESAGPSRKTTQLGGRPMHGGLWEGLTPGGEIDDSILGGRAGMGHGAGAMLGQAQGGLFTPDPGMMMGGVAGGRGGPPAVGAKVQMLGRSQWDTPSSAGDMSVPSIQPPRRTLPIRSATSHASSTSAASSTTVTPATSTSNPSAVGGPPAMKRARGPARHAHTLAQDYDTPINGHASSTTHPHAAPTRAQPATGRDRDLKSIEQNASSTADADLPPRRSSRLKVALPGTKVGRTLNTTLAPGDRDKKGVPGIMSRSTTATSASGTDVTSPSGAETRPLSPISASSISHPQSAPTDASLQRGADVYLLSIVRAFALSYRSLSTFALAQAISALDSLPPCLQHSPLALSIIAIAFYEQSDYIRSRRAFEALYALESYSLIGVHLFSTLLWHLADAPASSHLSQHAVSISKDRAEVWVAVGNTLSLGGDREGALRCFMRATAVGVGVRAGRTGVVGLKSLGQGDRVRAYAYTLAGYECVELEEFERGVEMYRLAIRTDGRLYNAWYGLGQAYMKMSKPKYAEHHFRRAVEMNPGNPILLCCLGQVLEAQEDNRAALAIYTRAASLHLPSSSNSTSTSNANVNTYNPLIPPLVQFKRIRVLIVLSRLPEALALLEPLAKALPDEAQVLLLLGKCYLAMGRRKEGVQALTEARELVPRLGSKVGGLIGGEGESEEED